MANGVEISDKGSVEQHNKIVLEEFKKLTAQWVWVVLHADPNGKFYLSGEKNAESLPKDPNPWGDWDKNPWVKGEKFDHSSHHQEIMIREFANTLQKLKNLDFSDYKKVLMWVNHFVVYGKFNYTNQVMSRFGKGNVISVFEKNGYLASDAWKKWNPDDPEYVARWIICNLVEGLKNHQCVAHQAIELQIEKWRRNFGDERDIL